MVRDRFVVARRCLAIGAVALGAGCGPSTLETVPEELIGTWQTRGPGYEQRRLVVSPDQIEIGAGRLVLSRFRIERVELDRGRDGRTYSLHYTADEGYPDSLEMTFVGSGAAVTIDSIPHVWIKRPAS